MEKQIANFEATMQDAKFIQMCANIAKQMGITPEQWNQDKVAIMTMIYLEMNK
jgi:hypothetical protein